jgi:hypothetical protein
MDFSDIDISSYYPEYPDSSFPNFANLIAHKKEFYLDTLDEFEEKPKKSGTLFKSQKFISEFLSTITPYDFLILFWKMGKGKCIHPNTKVIVDGKSIPIEECWKLYSQDITYFEDEEWSSSKHPLYVESYDIDNKSYVKVQISKLYRQKYKGVMKKLTLETGIVILSTLKHKFLTSDNIWYSVIFENDKLVTKDGLVKVIDIEFTLYDGYVYDFEVPKYSNYLIETNIVTHNTCAVVGAIENIRQEMKHPFWSGGYNKKAFQKALILVKGPAVKRNFINELIFRCTPGQYIPDNYDELSDPMKTLKKNRVIADFYEIDTFEVFVKNLSTMSDEHIIKRYSNRVIVIDEIHNIRRKDKILGKYNLYEQIFRLFHLVVNTKKILLSGTPMKDKAEEIADILNLGLPLDQQFPTGNHFNSIVFDQNRRITDKGRDILYNAFNGRFSYLGHTQSDIKIVYKGVENLTYGRDTNNQITVQSFILYPSTMSDFQQNGYIKAYSIDKKINIDEEEENDESSSGIYPNSRQATNFVYPDGEWKSSTYFGRRGKSLVIKPALINALLEYNEEKKSNVISIDKLRIYSSVFAEIIKDILDHPNEITFVYIDIVTGNGAILLGKLLELFGYQLTKGYNSTKARRYAIITGETATDKTTINIMDASNNPNNRYGEYLQVIIGSKIASEGFSLKNVRRVHAKPYWNFSEVEQGLYRAIRIFSHDDLIKDGIDVKVTIFLHVAMLYTYIPKIIPIDLYMFKLSADKDYMIKQVEQVVKESAVDCALNFKQNYNKVGIDYSRECNYSECFYRCVNYNPDTELDSNTYDLFYSKEEKDRIIRYLSRSTFTDKYIVSFDEIRSLFPDSSNYVLLDTLREAIDSNIIIYTKNGSESYIREDSNLYFLSTNAMYKNKFEDIYYSIYPSLIKNNNINQVLLALEKKHAFNKDINEVGFHVISTHLTPNMNNKIFEAAIHAKEMGSRCSFILPIIEEFSDRIIEEKEDMLVVKHPNYPLLRSYNFSDGWKDSSDVSIDTKQEKKITTPYDLASFGYVMLIRGGKQIIRKYAPEKKDARIKGIACTSWTKQKLMNFILEKNISFDLKYIRSIYTNSNLVNEFSKLNLPSGIIISNIPKTVMATVLFIKNNKTKDSCNVLYEWFEKRELIQDS